MGSLSGRRIMVTSGGTREYIDDVRVLTNISTGALGAKIAEELYNRGAEVYYVFGRQSYLPRGAHNTNSHAKISTYSITTTQELMESMEVLIKGFKIDSVVHSAAVSDFTFKNTGNVKLSSNSKADFIQFLEKTVRTTPKIIRRVKKWNPDITLVGFKFTVGKNIKQICEIAIDAMKKNKSDMIVANDKMEIVGTHRAYLIPSSNSSISYSPTYLHSAIMGEIQNEEESRIIVRDGKTAIADGIADFLDGSF